MCYTCLMDQELKNKLDTLEKKLEKVSIDVRVIKSIFFWTFIISVALIIVPIIILIFMIPQISPGLNSSSYFNYAKILNL